MIFFEDSNLQGHSNQTAAAAPLLPLSVPFGVMRSPPKNNCGYLRRRGATEKMRSGQGGEKKEQLE